MDHTSALRRLAIVAAVGGAAIAASPAVAAASSTCSYNPDTKSVIVDDHSGQGKFLRIFRSGTSIRIDDGSVPAGILCTAPGAFNIATVFNTDRIAVFGSASDASFVDGYTIDMRGGFLGPGATPETDGASEIEVAINTPGIHAPIEVVGTHTSDPTTHGNDAIYAGAGGKINLGYFQFDGLDEDVDVTTSATPTYVLLDGVDGDDTLTGGGNIVSRNPGPADYKVAAYGREGNDQVNGGAAADDLRGGEGADRFFSVDANSDVVSDDGSDGKTDFAYVDRLDFGGGIEQRVVEAPVGTLKLAPAILHARAGRPAAVNLAWTHPHRWKALRTLRLRARTLAGKVVGTVTVDTLHARVHSHGALTATRASKVGHHGKTVSARLMLRADSSLAGQGLQLEVRATDAHGRRQLEPLAGRLAVTG